MRFGTKASIRWEDAVPALGTLSVVTDLNMWLVG